MTATELSARVGRKENALRAVAEASESVIAAKTDLEFSKNRLTLEGLYGTNGRQRQADLAAKTESEHEGLALAEKKLRKAPPELDIAALRI